MSIFNDGDSYGYHTGYWFDLHIGSWAVNNAVHIEGDNIVFQLGYDQICVFNPESGKITLIARGKEPVVALKEQRESESPMPVDELQEADSDEAVAPLTNEEIRNIIERVKIRKHYAAVEGAFFDKGRPLVGIIVVAEQEYPDENAKKLEGITDSKGVFHIEGLEPEKRYTLTPHSEKWFTKSFICSFRSGKPGTTKNLQEGRSGSIPNSKL